MHSAGQEQFVAVTDRPFAEQVKLLVHVFPLRNGEETAAVS